MSLDTLLAILNKAGQLAHARRVVAARILASR